jgi:uncharacterized protein DUF4231
MVWNMSALEAESPEWWRLWTRSKLRRQRRQRQRFALAAWLPGLEHLNPGQNQYVRLRWAGSIELMDNRHRRSVSLFYTLRTTSILGGVAVTALSGIGLSGSSSSPGIRWTIFALGFVVAASAGIEQLGHYGQHRVLSRQTREQLLSAGFGYLLPAADPSQFDSFRDDVEKIIDTHNEAYNRSISDR